MKHSEKIVLLPVKPSLAAAFKEEPREEQQCDPAQGMRGPSSPHALGLSLTPTRYSGPGVP